MQSIVCSRHFLILLMATLFVLTARPARADAPSYGFLFANADAGWETMRLHGNSGIDYHHGFSATLSVGMNILCFMGLQIEQDLGFIHLNRTHDGQGSEMLFKGATFITWPLFSPPLSAASKNYPNLFVHLKLGVGGIYMEAPKGSGKSIQGWLAFRPTLAILCLSDGYGKDAIGGGIELGYTLAYSESNVFDHRDTVHFLNLKAKFMVTF